MAYEKFYPYGWQSGPNGGTPITPEALNHIEQGIMNSAPAVESNDYPGCYYRVVNGATEWLNPPMLPGVEYRTTKRRNGKVVYAKYIDLGTMPSSGAKSTVYYSSGSTSVVAEVYLVTSSGNVSPIPYFNTNGSLGVTLSITRYSVSVTAQYDVSAHTGFAIVYYTKD